MEIAQANGLTGSVLFYSQPEPLNKELHGKLGLVRNAHPYKFAAEGHVVPVTVTEFGPAALSYPIIFAGDLKQPLVVTGLNAGQSMFVSPEGSYDVGAYIPAYVRRYPFVLAADEPNGRMIVCIDRSSNLLAEGGDVPLFDEAGEPTEYTKNAITFCDDFENERRRTEAFVNLITELDLFETKEAFFTPMNPDGTAGEPQRIAEYFAVSEEKLKTLSPEKMAELRDNGALQQIYAHLLSLAGWERLIALAIAQQAQGPGAANLN
ncbi:MAG: peptidase [Caulobacter sp.]|nr:peptidase [Caulobacter sp.]